MQRRVFVTGTGAVCPLGNTVAEAFARLARGESAISKRVIDGIECWSAKASFASNEPRFIEMARAAARQALKVAAVHTRYNSNRIVATESEIRESILEAVGSADLFKSRDLHTRSHTPCQACRVRWWHKSLA